MKLPKPRGSNFAKAESGPVASNLPKLTEFMAYWLREVVKLNLAPKTYEKYEMFTRLYVVPYLGGKRLDKLTPRDVRTWLNQLRDTCQCCAVSVALSVLRPGQRRIKIKLRLSRAENRSPPSVEAWS